MSFPEDIDFDKVADHALNDAGKSMSRWLDGYPKDEAAFMNHLTGIFSRNRRNCDVGVDSPVGLESRLYMLHRGDDDSSDKYGADVAVTIFVNESYLKTALFQLKRSENYEFRIEEDQVEDACKMQAIEDRSYLMAVDEVRSGFRINHISEMKGEFGGDDSKKFEAAEWMCLTRWIWNWFSCDSGPESDPENPIVEELLKSFAINDDWVSPWASLERDQLLTDLPDDYVPTKSWMLFFFEKEVQK